jgi:UDP-N-acetyl-D-galactosamine dehydrogenase
MKKDIVANMDRKKIAIVGLGYVGLPLAVEFGKLRPTVGFDINPVRIENLRKKVDSTKELSVEELEASKFLHLTNDVDDLIDVQVFIITVPTPVTESKIPDFSYLISASKIVGGKLKPGDIVIYESTVYPGATEEICVPVLKNESGLEYADSEKFSGNKVFYCGYSPERINPGDKAHKITSIKKITSGSTPQIANEIDDLYSEIITAGTYKASSIKIAEAAKVIENSQRDLNIAFVNELAIIFARMNIDTAEVLEAAGTKWNFLKFAPGLVGGHCIGVDPFYLTYQSQKFGYIPEVILAGRRVNDGMAGFIAKNVIKKLSANGHKINESLVHVLGVSFKENCPDIRNSKVFDLIKELESWGVNVFASDPVADPDEVLAEYGIQLNNDCFNQFIPRCNVIILAVTHKEYLSLLPHDFLALCSEGSRSIFVDVKSALSREALQGLGFDLIRL